jgi:type III restriction enzyme
MSVVLKPFQERHRDAIVEIVDDTAQKILDAPGSRVKISNAQGCILLEAPTGSGKTLTIADALTKMRTGVPTLGYSKRRVIWFWFAPFADLVDQTIAAIRAETDLTVRDPRDDREATITQDGDVFVSTWQSVAAKDTKSRKMREDTESMPSLDTLVARLKDEGFFVGAVIDEAHQNFKTAPQALSFYLDVLKPDFTIMATATPNDADLKQFQRLAGITRVSRLSVSRQEVVDAGLNKTGVKAFYFRAAEKDEALLDYDEIAIFSGVERHNQIKESLKRQGISLTPLLLVQVENYQESVDRARATLIRAGLSPDAIGVHTAQEPDKNLRAIAYDESKEALIFKMAVATGFDAPRAWALVSLRSSRSVSFGLQVIGRIMRVHTRLQSPPHEDAALLDYGHVFLADATAQTGLQGAAEQIKAVATEIRAVTDDVSIVEVGTGRVALTDPNGGFAELLFPEPERASADPSTFHLPPTDQPAEFAGALFDLVNQMEHDVGEMRKIEGGEAVAPEAAPFTYPLRKDLQFPMQLMRESMPADMTGLQECIAQRIRFDDAVINLIMRAKGTVKMTEEDLFAGLKQGVEKKFSFSLDKAEAAAQLAFRFNDSLDPRDLKRALVQRLRSELQKRGFDDQPDDILRRTIDVALYLNKNLLSDACKECLSLRVESHRADPLPGSIPSKTELAASTKGVYAVFGPRMNDWEYRFAQKVDEDPTGTVLWWIRNVENARWACRIVRPSGKFFFPDFLIGVAGRKKLDNVALAEVKERIESEDSLEKIRVDHKDYGSALMVTWDEDDKKWYVVGYNAAVDKNQLVKEFDVQDFRLLQ